MFFLNSTISWNLYSANSICCLDFIALCMYIASNKFCMPLATRARCSPYHTTFCFCILLRILCTQITHSLYFLTLARMVSSSNDSDRNDFRIRLALSLIGTLIIPATLAVNVFFILRLCLISMLGPCLRIFLCIRMVTSLTDSRSLRRISLTSRSRVNICQVLVIWCYRALSSSQSRPCLRIALRLIL